jgi:aspartyl-tRNA(Asn)/glutamyl-tRNA(Gln) amidotransferase subunit C
MISESEVQKLADLARIEVSEAERAEFQQEIDQILAYVSQLSGTENTPAQTTGGEHHNIFREDENAHESGAFTEDLLANAPAREGNYITIGKVIKGAE